jgi:hypothetical protein
MTAAPQKIKSDLAQSRKEILLKLFFAALREEAV